MEAAAKFFLQYWALLAFVVGLVSAWALLRYQQGLNVKDICKIKKDKEEEGKLLANIQDRLGNIETSIKYMKETMDNLNNFLQILLKQELKK